MNGDNDNEKDCEKSEDGGKGIVSLDLTSYLLSGVSIPEYNIIERLAARDTIKSHRYANRIVALMSNMDGAFHKELLVVWRA